jgi:hypothetical protein
MLKDPAMGEEIKNTEKWRTIFAGKFKRGS